MSNLAVAVATSVVVTFVVTVIIVLVLVALVMYFVLTRRRAQSSTEAAADSISHTSDPLYETVNTLNPEQENFEMEQNNAYGPVGP